MSGKNVVELTDAGFPALVKGDKLVLVDFWATWCGPCMAIGPVLEALAQEYPDQIIVGKMNVDQHRETATRFGITSIPTILVFKGSDKPVDSIVGLRPKGYIKGVIDKHL